MLSTSRLNFFHIILFVLIVHAAITFGYAVYMGVWWPFFIFLGIVLGGAIFIFVWSTVQAIFLAPLFWIVSTLFDRDTKIASKNVGRSVDLQQNVGELDQIAGHDNARSKASDEDK